MAGHFVIVHIDGDSSWSSRSRSQTDENFRQKLVEPVCQVLRENGYDPADPRGRLIAMVPFYSIESWLLHATATARELCASNSRCRETLDQLAEWEADRGLLDEVVKPKEATCLRDNHNAKLAEGLTRVEVQAMHAAGKSFAAFVTALAGAHDISGYLARLRR